MMTDGELASRRRTATAAGANQDMWLWRVASLRVDHVTRGNRTEQEASTMAEETLYDRLGGVFAIAAVVNHFSDSVVENPIVGQRSKNPELREWHTEKVAARLPGLKFMRTLWLCDVAGGPFHFAATKPGRTALGLEEAHRDFQITPDEFDEVAAELGRSLDFFNVPEKERGEVLAAFAAHKGEVTEGALVEARH
jgi:hemoglobin